jgi:hypothetical protein
VTPFPKELVALNALPDISQSTESVFWPLFGTVETPVTDATAFGVVRQFDSDTMGLQFSELTLDVPRCKEDCVVRLRGS